MQKPHFSRLFSTIGLLAFALHFEGALAEENKPIPSVCKELSGKSDAERWENSKEYFKRIKQELTIASEYHAQYALATNATTAGKAHLGKGVQAQKDHLHLLLAQIRKFCAEDQKANEKFSKQFASDALVDQLKGSHSETCEYKGIINTLDQAEKSLTQSRKNLKNIFDDIVKSHSTQKAANKNAIESYLQNLPLRQSESKEKFSGELNAEWNYIWSQVPSNSLYGKIYTGLYDNVTVLDKSIASLQERKKKLIASNDKCKSILAGDVTGTAGGSASGISGGTATQGAAQNTASVQGAEAKAPPEKPTKEVDLTPKTAGKPQNILPENLTPPTGKETTATTATTATTTTSTTPTKYGNGGHTEAGGGVPGKSTSTSTTTTRPSNWLSGGRNDETGYGEDEYTGGSSTTSAGSSSGNGGTTTTPGGVYGTADHTEAGGGVPAATPAPTQKLATDEILESPNSGSGGNNNWGVADQVTGGGTTTSEPGWFSRNQDALIVGGVGAAAVGGLLWYKSSSDAEKNKEIKKLKKELKEARKPASTSSASGTSTSTGTNTSTTTTAKKFITSGIPTSIYVGIKLPTIQVAIVNPDNTPTTDSTTDVTIGCATPDICSITGTLTVKAVNGIATFDNVEFSNPDQGVKLLFTGANIESHTTTATFNVQ